MNISEEKRSATTSRVAGALALPALLAALLALSTACVAQTEDLEHADSVDDDAVTAETRTRLEEQTATVETVAAGTTTAIPATPEPNEPQPSPWGPKNPSLELGAGDNPIAAPQPSPWQGHSPLPVPVPGGPPTIEPNGPSELTAATPSH